jgi:RHS repeat-associated protein
VQPDGTRRVIVGHLSQLNPTDWQFQGTAADGSQIACIATVRIPQGFEWLSAQIRYPDGTRVEFGAGPPGPQLYYPTQYPTRITDANGNIVTITYLNGLGPRIEQVVDTANRAIEFYYNSNGLLVAVGAPDVGAGMRDVLVLDYVRRDLPGTFPNHPIKVIYGDVIGGPVLAIQHVYSPPTSTGYSFGSSYSDYGILTRVAERTGAWSSGNRCVFRQPCDGRQIDDSHTSEIHSRTYDFTLINDELTYTRMTEWWRDMDTASLVTLYARSVQGNTQQLDVTFLPSGIVKRTLSFTGFTAFTGGEWQNGLPFETSVYNGTTLMQRTSTTYQLNPGGWGQRQRVESRDELGQMTAVEFSYSDRNEVTEVREYDYGGGTTALRTTRTNYQSAQGYGDRWHFNLPTWVDVLDSNGARVSRTEYAYDGSSLTAYGDAVQHDAHFNPGDPLYDPSTQYRGNVTSITRYADAVAPSSPVGETFSYDMTGNAVSFSGSCCELTSVQYTRNNGYAYPESLTRGAPSAQVTTSSGYDFGTGLVTSTTDANGIANQTSYYAGSLRPQRVTLHTNGKTDFAYDDTNLSVTTTTTTSDGLVAAWVVQRLNGLGQLHHQETYTEGNQWDKVDFQYDEMKRLMGQSRPFRGASASQWMVTQYDSLSRVKVLSTWPGASAGTLRYFYNESGDPPGSSSHLPGQTVRTQDPWGREKWSRADALGRLAEVVEPASGAVGDRSIFANGSKATVYSYNALDKLTAVTSMEGTWPSTYPVQQRSFKYDGLGRLTHQKLSEKQATLDNSGQYVGSGGTWSDFFNYDQRSNVASHTDARGARADFNYNILPGQLDPLNRLQSVSYVNTTGDNSIVPAPTVNYGYMTTGDLMRLLQVRTQGVLTETYGYDGEGRLSTRTQQFNDVTSSDIVTEYTFDTLNRPQSLRYPADYGMPGAPRSLVQKVYDVQSRLNSLYLDSNSVASSITYNEASQVAWLYAGLIGSTSSPLELYSYDAETGVLSGQAFFQNQRPLLDVTYNYLLPGTQQGKTGQLVDFQNNLNPEESQRYSYDALGRLTDVAGGSLGNPFWWQDYAYDRYGNRTSSNAHTSAGPADGPSDGLLHATAVSTTQVHLEWGQQGFSGGRQLRLERSTDGSNFTPVVTLPSDQQSYEDVGLNPCTLYCYRLGVQVSPTQWIYLAPPNPTAVTYGTGAEVPAAPQNLRVRSVSPNSATLDFDYVSCPFGSGGPGDLEQPRGQLVLESLGPDGQFHEVDSQLYYSGTLDGTHEFVEQTLTPSTQYYFHVLVQDFVQGSSVPSNVASVVTQVPPSAPTGLSVTAASNDGVALQWQYSGVAVTGFEIWRQSTGHGAHLVGTAGPNDSTFFDSSAHFMGQYTYWVFAHLGNIYSGASNTANTSLPLVQDGVTSLSYDNASNRITSANYAYDAAGNLTRAVQADGSIQNYQYDTAGRLASVTDGQGRSIESYSYGDTRHRLVTTFPNGDIAKAYQVWNGDSVLAEYEATTASPQSLRWKRSYVYLGSRLLATRTNVSGQVKIEFHHPDRLGTRVITDGSSVNYQEALPFGTSAKTATHAAASDVLFTSYHRSQNTGLDNAVNRNYSPGLGRFLQVDPIGVSSSNLSNPQSLNLYAYGTNDPINSVDPTGTETICVQIMDPEQCGLGGQDDRHDRCYACYETVDATVPPWWERLPLSEGPGVSTLGPGDAEDPLAFESPNSPEQPQQTCTTSPPNEHPFRDAILKLVTTQNSPAERLAQLVFPDFHSTNQAGIYAENPDFTAIAMGISSQINRTAFRMERQGFWKAEATNNPAKYSQADLTRMQRGLAPIGPDGYPMELHHLDRTSEGGVQPLSRTDHRLGANYLKNHPPQCGGE